MSPEFLKPVTTFKSILKKAGMKVLPGHIYNDEGRFYWTHQQYYQVTYIMTKEGICI
ncbi:hypothetical protein YC2023_084631 [Brassica napus]